MNELELSLMNYGYDTEGLIRPLLTQFEQEHRCRVRIKMIPWGTGRQELVNIALYGKGPDISEIGTTWCSSFISMEALHPFTSSELSSLGGSSTFFPSSWQSCQLNGADRMWAIPWLASLRVLYYRRDLLEKAGVDEKTAFLSHSHLIKTLKQLQTSGIPTPLVLATRNITPPGLHGLASWVWGAGGDFVSADGASTLLNQPEMRAGLCNFLELSRYLSPQARGLVAAQSEALFWRGDAAVSLSFQPPILTVLKGIANPEVIANLGVTSMPGVTFIGGSNLVIWRHIPLAHETLAMELVRFLTNQQAQINFNTKIGFFPTRPDVMQNPPFSTDPLHQVLMKGLNSGRSFPTITQWAIVEDRLLNMLGQLWEDVLSQPDQDVDSIIADRLEQLARRLDMMLRPA